MLTSSSSISRHSRQLWILGHLALGENINLGYPDYQCLPLSLQHGPRPFLCGLLFALIPRWKDGLRVSLTKVLLKTPPSGKELRIAKTCLNMHQGYDHGIHAVVEQTGSWNLTSHTKEMQRKLKKWVSCVNSYQYGNQSTDEGGQGNHWRKDCVLELLNQTTGHWGLRNLVGIKKFQF